MSYKDIIDVNCGDTVDINYKYAVELKDYKYKELCSIFGEDISFGNSKKSQLKRWSRYFRWENPTKQTYRVVEIYDEPKDIEDGRKNNGGARGNSGSKGKLNDEFSWLLNSFLHREFNRNVSGGRGGLCVCRFTGNEISKYFGMYTDSFYNAVSEYVESLGNKGVSSSIIASKTSVFRHAWGDISKKISEKRRTWIYNKIDRLDGVKFGYGVIGYKNDERNEFEYLDDELESWNRYKDRFLKRNDLKNEGMVADRGMYLNMIQNISLNFDDYASVERVRKMEFDIKILKEYDFDELDDYRKKFNDALVDELIEFFKKRVGNEAFGIYEYIIDTYVRI